MKYKGIAFDDVHTFDDLNLVLSDCPDMPPAKAKTTYIDIPGADGSLDLSEVHGEVKFSDRENKYTFTMHPAETMTWEEKMTEVSNLLNGKRCKMILDKDEDFYWDVRATVDSYKSDKRLHKIVISVRALPYKFKQNITSRTVQLSGGSQTINLTNGRKSVCPSIECSNDNTVIVFGGATFNLSAGKHEILDIQFVEGTNTLAVSGSGTVTFSYQEGDL
jgi:phage-related protein